MIIEERVDLLQVKVFSSRADMGMAAGKDVAERIQQKLANMGCGVELMDKLSLLAVNVPENAPTAEVLSFLDEEVEKGNIGIEESSVRYQ